MRVFFFWMTRYAVERFEGPGNLSPGGPLVSANSEIAWHYAEALRQAFGAVVCKDMGNVLPPDAGPDDVYVGFIGPWAADALDKGFKRVLPMCSWPSKNAWPYDKQVYGPEHTALLDRIDSFVALCGSWVWEESAKDPKLSRWRSKATQMPLGFSRKLFPQIKHGFNPPGKRAFFYLGQIGAQKAITDYAPIMRRLNYKLLVANGEWKNAGPNVEILGWVDNAGNPELWERVAKTCDFFLAPMRWDCQPVAPLENISRGFVPMCSPAACFPESIPLTGNPNLDAKSLEQWQKMPTDALVAAQARAIAALEAMPWDAATGKLIAAIQELL